MINVDLSGSSITDLTGIELCTSLEVLSLWDNNINDISDLASLTRLQYLDLDNNAIIDISVLAELNELQELYLNGNELKRAAYAIHIPALEAKGISIEYDPEPKNNPSDINNDGLINIFNLVAIASQSGQSGENLDGDVNGDGTVNIFDLIEVAQHFCE